MQQSGFVIVRHLLQNRETLEVLGHEETSFRDSRGSISLEFIAQLCRVDSAGEKCLKRVSDLLNLVCRFMDEFQTKVMNAGLAPRIEMRTCFLRLRAEDRIPAANVSYYRMRPALWISQGDPMLFAWTAAIAVGSAGGEESAEDAMLCVEDGQMLIGNGFHPLRTDGCG